MLNLPQITTKEQFEGNFLCESWLAAANAICVANSISYNEIKRAGGSEHIVFLLDGKFVLKIYKSFRNCFEREVRSLELLHGKIDLKIPEIIKTGEFEGFQFVLMTPLDFAAKLAFGLKQIHELYNDLFENNWSAFVKDRAETFIDRQIAHGVNRKVLDALPAFIEENLKLVPTTSQTIFMHADVYFGNLRLENYSRKLSIGGLFDFADSRRGWFEYDFLAPGLLMFQGQRSVQREFFKSYGYAEKDLDENMRKRLMMLTMLYETADLRRYATRLKPEAVEFSLEELERGIWNFV